MNLNKKIGFLLDIGFTPKFVSSLNENKINLLFEKMSNKGENKEATTSVVKQTKMSKAELDSMLQSGKEVKGTIAQTGSDVTITNESEITEDEFYTDLSGGKTQEPEDEESQDYPGSDRGKPGEQESLEERFESKAQQGLFWARCNKCKSDDCKWCKMAKEFSKSTSKKQYKDMPEKKHPEKTVKYKKKETKENFTFKDYLGKLGSTYTSEMAKKVKGTTPTFSESIFEKNLENIIQENLKPTMKKRDLLRLIEASMGDTKEKEETETKPDVKPDVKPPKTPNPFQKPNPNPAEAIKTKIEKLQDKLDSTDDETKIEKLEDKIKELKSELRALKKKEIDEGKSEFMSKVKEMGFLKK